MPTTTVIGSMPATRSKSRWTARATACRFNCKRRSTRFTPDCQPSPAHMADWHYVLPAVAGLDFWNDASGGTQLTGVDGVGDLVNDPYPSSGQYNLRRSMPPLIRMVPWRQTPRTTRRPLSRLPARSPGLTKRTSKPWYHAQQTRIHISESLTRRQLGT